MLTALLVPDFMIRHFTEPGVFNETYVTVASSFFSMGWILFFMIACTMTMTKKLGKTVFSVITIIFTLLSLSECIYYKIFEQFFWLKSIGLAGEGVDYIGYVSEMTEPWMITYLVISLISVIGALFTWSSPNSNKKWRLLFILLPVVILASTHITMQPSLHGDSTDEWDVWRKPRIVYDNFNDANKTVEISGIYQFCYLNLYDMITDGDKTLSEAERCIADEYFSSKPKHQKNKYSDILKGKNVIAVMMESIDTWMIDRKTTPTIYKMMRNGINFTDYNAPFFGVGFTLSSEFAFNTGFFTPVSAGSASNFSKNTFPYSLARLFKESGYTTQSFHFNNSEFYNRGILHKAFGYDKYNGADDFGITGFEAELDSNLIKNDEFYKKMTEKTPFFNFFITYSAHLPYQGESEKLVLARENRSDLINEKENLEKNNGKILAADTDEFFRILLERLSADGLLEDTVIIAYTDHFAYGISDSELVNNWKGRTRSYCVPAFIYNPKLKSAKISKPMMTIDWAPTIVNLFGLSDDAVYLGNDVLDSQNEGLVYFETGDWLDGNMYYTSSADYSQHKNLLHIQNQTQRVKKNMQINDIVILGDYYRDN